MPGLPLFFLTRFNAACRFERLTTRSIKSLAPKHSCPCVAVGSSSLRSSYRGFTPTRQRSSSCQDISGYLPSRLTSVCALLIRSVLRRSQHRLLRPLLTSRSTSAASSLRTQGEISPGKNTPLHCTTADLRRLSLDHRSFAVSLPARPTRRRLSSGSCTSAHGFAPRFLPTLGRPHAVALRFDLDDLLSTRTCTCKTAPMRAHQRKAPARCESRGRTVSASNGKDTSLTDASKHARASDLARAPSLPRHRLNRMRLDATGSGRSRFPHRRSAISRRRRRRRPPRPAGVAAIVVVSTGVSDSGTSVCAGVAQHRRRPSYRRRRRPSPPPSLPADPAAPAVPADPAAPAVPPLPAAPPAPHTATAPPAPAAPPLPPAHQHRPCHRRRRAACAACAACAGLTRPAAPAAPPAPAPPALPAAPPVAPPVPAEPLYHSCSTRARVPPVPVVRRHRRRRPTPWAPQEALRESNEAYAFVISFPFFLK